jgi:hypothetical protein
MVWLPKIVSVEGNWCEIASRLYCIFVADIKDGKPYFQNREIWWDRQILPGEEYEEGFWRLITRSDELVHERLIDYRRAERLPWCAPTICNSADASVKVWDYVEGRRKVRTYLWIEAHDYVVVLEKQSKGLRKVAFLVTAYHVDGDSRRRALLKKYNASQSVKMQSPP